MSNQKRELNFKAVENTAPKTLSPEQIREFNEKGFLFPLDALDPTEAKSHLEFVNHLMKETHERGGNGYTINCKHEFLKTLYDLCLHPKILAVVRDLLGEEFLAWGTHYFSKESGDAKQVAWHQDASYWPLTPSRTITVWLAIDDVDEENSAMQVIPGTHLKGHLPWKEVKSPAVLDQELTDVEKLGDPVSACLKAGQFSVHTDMTAHGSQPNFSDRRRCGLTIRYCPKEVRAVSNNGWCSAIHCSGTKAPHWDYLERPESDDIESSIKHLDKNMANAAR